MPSTDDTFITLLLDQPAIYWSLVAAGSILLLAIFLWAALNIGGRLQRRQVQRDESALAAAAARSVATAPRDLPPGLAELIEENDDDKTSKIPRPVVTGDRPAVAMASGDGGDGAPKIREMNGIPDTDVVTDEPVAPAVLEDESELMALFETDVIVDPHVKALRDNLPEIEIQALLNQLQSVSRQLQERNAAPQP